MDTTQRSDLLTGLTPTGRKALDLITKFLAAEGLKLGDGFFASGSAWASRGEPYSRGAHLVVVYDGAPGLRSACSLDGGNYDRNERLRATLAAAGLYFEEGTHWYGGVYSIG